MALTDTFVKQVKHTGSEAGNKHSDGGGMYLLVKAGGKYWRMDYRFTEKRKTLALGVYPEVSLAKARSGATRRANCWPKGLTPAQPNARPSMRRPVQPRIRLRRLHGTG